MILSLLYLLDAKMKYNHMNNVQNDFSKFTKHASSDIFSRRFHIPITRSHVVLFVIGLDHLVNSMIYFTITLCNLKASGPHM